MKPETRNAIRVLIVEDSPVIREFLSNVLRSDPQLKVECTARTGEEAVAKVKECEPDIVTMDIHMPEMDGFEATRKIMETHPVPIVIVSRTTSIHEVSTMFRALEAGALTVVPSPYGFGHPEHEKSAEELIKTVKLMSEVKVVKRWRRAAFDRKERVIAPSAAEESAVSRAEIKIVAIGSSTGGPLVLQTILSRLPKNFPAPVVIVQHIASGFLSGMAEWLAQSTPLSLHIAEHGMKLEPGHAYLAPDNLHMGVEKNSHVVLTRDTPENGMRPSVSYLFRTVAENFGKYAAGVLLTGMGKDGAEELKFMRENGAVTIAQDYESSVVHGMPGAAIKLDAAKFVLPPEEIAALLENLTWKGD